jgi:cytochrome c553
MRYCLYSHLLAATVILFSTATLADMTGNSIMGSIEAGEEKSKSCKTCHGKTGHSPSAAWPSLAGQHESYIALQLQAFKTNNRMNVMMQGQAANMTTQDMHDVGAYYANQQPLIKADKDTSKIEAGKKLYTNGNTESGMQACVVCHEADGRGNSTVPYPSLQGLKSRYLAAQMRAYASGERTSPIMKDIARSLNEEDILAVSSYIQGLK